jgi:hypothetical protein
LTLAGEYFASDPRVAESQNRIEMPAVARIDHGRIDPQRAASRVPELRAQQLVQFAPRISASTGP